MISQQNQRPEKTTNTTPKRQGLLDKIKKNKIAYLYVLPAMLVVLMISLGPILYGIGLSFFNANLYTMGQGTVKFVGLRNYFRAIGSMDAEFLIVLFRTFIWTIVNVFFHVSIGLIIAIALNRPKLRGKGIYRTLVILPWAVPQFVTALVWKMMYNEQFGFFNQILEMMGIPAVSWTSHAGMAFVSAIIVNIWLGFPFMTMVATGALQSIPRDYYEAADIDGASGWQKFKNITIPLLKPAMLPATILGTIWTFTNFNVIYLITGGGPGKATEIVSTYQFNILTQQNAYSMAATYSVIVSIILIIITAINMRVTKALSQEGVE
ncbi:carbohydrate ABC transporter permease [Alkaliphilus hydrothermalis]|uniref:Arabinogalactan oligomer/maltooligosaccharide transport system permease protein n=1 Tax=Alkaliphilus hydrothermalis TaxID=1482730 RepID=A0ABS2NRT9_9FIRM|nr:sugar ABC transporter permease [Alkaliphilus hydrothermalis]MBM7615655.1 arabinogalactan oligomer/maltooligosaccharide transport system permease protein [Alkaliphilus hydrothermalis]